MAEAKPFPLTSEARIDRQNAYRLLDQIRTTLPVEFERARWSGREEDHHEGLESLLRQIGASIAELRAAQRAQAEDVTGSPLTATETEQVREIIEAAERTASVLKQEAVAEARRIKEEAHSELRSAREESERLRRESPERAAAEAAAYLRRVEAATKKMLERADAADSKIDVMVARMRGSGGSVIEDLEAVMAGLKEIEVGGSEEARAREAELAGEPRREHATPLRPGSRDRVESPSRPDSADARLSDRVPTES